MLKIIPNPKKTTAESDIEIQLQEAFVSTIAATNPSLDVLFCSTDAMKAIKDTLTLQADYIPLNASDMECVTARIKYENNPLCRLH
jgi:hypothetical protein